MKAGGKLPRAAEWILSVLVIVVACAALTLAGRIFYRAAYPVGYGEIVERESLRNGLDPALVYAVIRTESGFDPYAQSNVPARGLMQITRDTFEWAQMRLREERKLTFEDLFDSGENIRYGTAILRLLLDELKTERNALCAYHAGRTRALEWLRNPDCSPDGENIEYIPYGDTRRYVEKVLRTKETYEARYE